MLQRCYKVQRNFDISRLPVKVLISLFMAWLSMFFEWNKTQYSHSFNTQQVSECETEQFVTFLEHSVGYLNCFGCHVGWCTENFTQKWLTLSDKCRGLVFAKLHLTETSSWTLPPFSTFCPFVLFDLPYDFFLLQLFKLHYFVFIASENKNWKCHWLWFSIRYYGKKRFSSRIL